MITALMTLGKACESVSSSVNWEALSNAMKLSAEAIAEAKKEN